MDDGSEIGASPDVPEWPTVVSVVGQSGAGKTTLVETLCETLDRRVATIKSIHHEIEPDTPGTDTHRHRVAGADRVVGVTPSLTFEVARGGKGPDRTPATENAAVRDVLTRIARDDYDIVIVEGFSDAPLPTISVGAAEGTPGRTIGTGSDPIEELVAAIDTLEPFDPSTLVGGSEETPSG